MASENKYSLTIIAKSGDRVLTTIEYPAQNYGELVGAQHAIAAGFIKAGLQRAVIKGDDVPQGLLDLYGVEK